MNISDLACYYNGWQMRVTIDGWHTIYLGKIREIKFTPDGLLQCTFVWRLQAHIPHVHRTKQGKGSKSIVRPVWKRTFKHLTYETPVDDYRLNPEVNHGRLQFVSQGYKITFIPPGDAEFISSKSARSFSVIDE